MVDDIQNQSADNSGGPSGTVGALVASEYGSIFFDVAMPAGIEDEKRNLIRNSFEQVVTKLTGLKATKEDLGRLCAEMFDKMTSSKSKMPSHGKGMEAELNVANGYLAKIQEYCVAIGGNAPTIGGYKGGLDRTGTDFYCIGTDGKRYCYHFFELLPTGTAYGPILMPENAKFRICCVAKIEEE